jgi:hypothetical protein
VSLSGGVLGSDRSVSTGLICPVGPIRNNTGAAAVAARGVASAAVGSAGAASTSGSAVRTGSGATPLVTTLSLINSPRSSDSSLVLCTGPVATP